jgi:hypothetical protein
MNFENTMLSDRGQTQKTTDGMIYFLCNVQNRQIYRDKKRLGLEIKEMIAKGQKVSF